MDFKISENRMDKELDSITRETLLHSHNLDPQTVQREIQKEKETNLNGESGNVESKTPKHSPVTNAEASSRLLHYGITDNPPLHLCFLFALQQTLVSLTPSLGLAVLISELVCAKNDDAFKAQMLCTSLMLSAMCTFFQVTVGVRLPVYQGPTAFYIVPLFAMASLDEWRCPSDSELEAMANVTSNGSDVMSISRQISYERIAKLSGPLVMAGAIHALIGLTGIVGVFIKFVGPITVLPAIFLIGLHIYPVLIVFCETHWGVAALTTFTSIVLSLYLVKHNMPIPIWSRTRGFHVIRFPLHQVFSMLISIVIGWGLSGILTICGALTDDPNSKEFLARTDSRSNIITSTDWFYFPHPGQFGPISFSTGVFIQFLVATAVSIIDSIGDYYACAKMCQVPPPPVHSVNRGIAVEGFFSMIAGIFGACHATTTYGGNIGVIGITKVASRRVFQLFAIILFVFSILGKFGAVFITIPHSVLGGVMCAGFGTFIGLILSNLQYIDIKSTRNLSIIGISILIGLMMPYWVENNRSAIQTGSAGLDNVLEMLLGNSNFAGGALACFLDNTVSGTLEERGITVWHGDMKAKVNTKIGYEEGHQIYNLPIPNRMKSWKIAQYIPVLQTYDNKRRLSILKRCRDLYKRKSSI